MASDRFRALVDRHAAVMARLTEQLLRQVLGRWTPFTGFYDDAAVADVAAQMSASVTVAQRQAGRVTEQYLRRTLAEMGVATPRATVVELPDSLRAGTPLAEVYQRPAVTVRYLDSIDAPEPVRQARTRVEVLARTDVQLAQREAARQVLTVVPEVVGYRRVVHPELSVGGTCGLCIAAADRTYSREELLPIHGRCHCTVAPIVGAQDPGQRLNAQDLAELYRAAGGTDAARLKRVRYDVVQHGELGPSLVVQGQQFRGPEDLPDVA